MQRHAAPDQAGIPALRDHRPARLGAQRQHGRHLGGIAWPQHGQRPAPESPGPVDGEPRGRVSLQHMLLAHDAGQCPAEAARKHRP